MFIDFRGPAGRLEGIVSTPASPRFVAIVCHPHPQFGGTMHNHATFRLARALAARGGVVLRFHFRGVGRSEGEHDEGRGEVDDAAAALAEVSGRAPGLPRWVAGFSFGARTCLALAARTPGIEAALVIGVAVRSIDHSFARGLGIPIAAVQGEHDPFGSPAEVRALLGARPGPFRLATVAGASHLFAEDLDALEAAVGEATDWLLDALPPLPAKG